MRRFVRQFVIWSWLIPVAPLQAVIAFALIFALAFRFADRVF
jgi:hypothetical protein